MQHEKLTMCVNTGRDVTADAYAKAAQGTVFAGPVKNVILYVLVLKKNISINYLKPLMCAMAVLTKPDAPCKNVFMIRFLHIMNIKLSFQKQEKAFPFLKKTSSIWIG